MSIHQTLFATYDNPMIVVDSADFDGTNDWMTRAALTGAVNSKSGILSVWIRLDGGDGVAQRIVEGVEGTALFTFLRRNTNVFGIGGDNAAGTEILLLVSNTTYTASATWLHVLASWDLAAAAGHLYVNDVDDLAAGPTLTDDTIDYTLSAWGIATSAGTPGSLIVDGCLAEVYFAPGQYLDFSNAFNRRKFISASGKPVHLGTTGALPTGTAPLIYLHLDDGEAVASFATDRSGNANTFAITGTLATGSTSPSD
jgi:hypothetical protein